MTTKDKQQQNFRLSRAQFLKSALMLPLTGLVTQHAAAAAPAAATGPALATAKAPVKISAFIKFLQDMPPTDLANFLADTGFDGVEATVRAGGYVLPANVVEQLPRLADALDKRGLKIYTITTDITSVATPDAEKVLRAAEKLGIKRYRLGFLKYDLSKPVVDQVDELHPSIRELAALNKAHGITGVYQNHSGPEFVGAAIWDYYLLIKDIPREQMSFVYDTYHATAAGGAIWDATLNLARSHLSMVSVKDFKWINREVKGVPLGDGEVQPRMFDVLKAVYRGDYSLHVEYLEHAGLEANKKAFAQDLTKLRKLLS